MRTENRIGPRAYLSPGSAFAGGTLAREVALLNRMSAEGGVAAPLLSSVLPSNDLQKLWLYKKLRMLFTDLSQTTVAVWGLTYKQGTDTLRRSLSVEICDWMIREGATVHVHDPKVKSLPERWHGVVKRYDDPAAAVDGAHALILATEWPIYRTVSSDDLFRRADHLVVLDPNRFLPNLAAPTERLKYFAVGMPFND
jgi:UDPglucose 6-dehydrogenase